MVFKILGYKVLVKLKDSQFFNTFGYVQEPKALFDIPGHFSAMKGVEGDDASIIVGRQLSTVDEWQLVPIVETPEADQKYVPKYPTPEDWDNAECHDCQICGKVGAFTLRDSAGKNRCGNCWEDY